MMAPRRPRVLLADDHLMAAGALNSLLAPEFDLVGVVKDGRALVEAAGRLRPDVIVADVTMPQLNGIHALLQLRQHGDVVPVVFLTLHRDARFGRRALDAGASGFVLKHSAPAELVTAIRAALAGQTYLTPQLAGEVLESMKQRPLQDGGSVAALTPRLREAPKGSRRSRSPPGWASRRARQSSTSARRWKRRACTPMPSVGWPVPDALTRCASQPRLCSWRQRVGVVPDQRRKARVKTLASA
jgi:DNA-binding NarL/FixJ family response regulator